MKKVLTIAVLAVLCVSAFASNWGASVTFDPYRVTSSKAENETKSQVSDYQFAVSGDVYHWWDNGVIAGAYVSGGKTYYEGDVVFNNFEFEVFGGYTFYAKGNFYASASIGVGTAIATLDTLKVNCFSISGDVFGTYYFDNLPIGVQAGFGGHLSFADGRTGKSFRTIVGVTVDL